VRQSNALELARERGPRKGVPGSKGIGRGNAPRVAGAGHLSRGGRSMRSRSRSERRRASLWPWRRGHERRFTPTFGGKVKSHPRAREKRRSANRAVKRGTHRKAGESRAERSQRESVGARSRREDGIHRSHASRRAPSGQPGEASLGPTDFDHPVTRGRRKEVERVRDGRQRGRIRGVSSTCSREAVAARYDGRRSGRAAFGP
jgi:hypothetical protein